VQINWSTFVLEIVNFLILVWILKRFLYKPVLEAIAQRKAAIDKTLSDAKARQAEAQALEQQYKNRLADWENEKGKLRVELAEEINARRGQLMAALESSLGQEREKARVLEERRMDDLKKRAEEEGSAKGVEFTARVLARAACPELERKLIALILEDLSLLPEEQLRAIRVACKDAACQAKVTSAFPIGEAERSTIKQRLKDAVQRDISTEFHEDSRLLAGLRINIGPWVLRGNLLDELEFFGGALRYDLGKQ
jgi:F-type H+-transporting ATPase subunit b